MTMQPGGRPAILAPLVIAVLAFTLRCIALRIWQFSPHPQNDAAEYLALAHNIRFHGIFSFGAQHKWGETPSLEALGPFLPTAARAPLYPLLVAALWFTKAPPFLALGLVQAALGSATAALTYLMSARLLTPRGRWIAGLIVALSPLSILTATGVMSEALFTNLLTAGFFAWSRDRPNSAGILFGLATLARPILLPFILLIGLAGLLAPFNRSQHLRLAAAAIIILLPWTIRNAVTQHALIPVQTYGWSANLLYGTVDAPYGSGANPWATYNSDPGISSIVANSPDEATAEHRMGAAALARILADPIHWIGTRLHQYPRAFIDTGIYLFGVLPFAPSLIKLLSVVKSTLFIASTGIGLLRLRDAWHIAYLPAFFLLLTFAQAGPMYADLRYVIPAIPIMAIFATGVAFARSDRASQP